MAFGQQPKDAGGIPASSGYTPNAAFYALQGSLLTYTDNSSNVSTGFVTADQIQQAIMQGRGFVATTGALTTATNSNLTMGMSVFNPAASGKNLYIFSIKYHAFANSAAPKYNVTTTDPAYANVITPQNLKSGGSASVASVTSAANGATASISTSGTVQDIAALTAIGSYDFLSLPSGILLPSGAANGVAVYGLVATAGGSWGVTIRWIEF